MSLLLCIAATLILDTIQGYTIVGNSPPNYLAWNYTRMNPTCTGPGGGRNPCQDIRICNFAWASIMMDGRPTICGWVGKGVEKVCCGLPLILGKDLMEKIDEEKSRKRECGSKTYSRDLSKTENLFFKILSVTPSVDISNPNRFDPPLDLHFEPMTSSISGPFSRQGDYPWMVTIHRDSSFVCGGALIDRIHILSPAHCFSVAGERPDPSRYSVHMGDIYLDGGVRFSVSEVKVHPSYSPDSYYNDIAILTLDREILVPSIPHICLPPKDDDDGNMNGKDITLLGWSNTELGTETPPILNIVDNIRITTDSECSDNYGKVEKDKLFFNENFLCAVTSQDSKEFCQPDPGNLLMYKTSSVSDYDPDVHWTMFGIAALGNDCNEKNYPAIYTRISHYSEWIASNTAY